MHLPPRRGRAARIPRDFVFLLVAIGSMELATSMVVVGVGWQVYAIHRSAFDLGLIGLVQFVPALVLALPAGHLADRSSRRLLFAVSLLLSAVVTALLLVVTLTGASRLWPFLALACATGFALGIGAPAARALGPTLVPLDAMARGMALRSSAISIGVVVGPAVGGVLFAVRPALMYGVAVGLLTVALVVTLGMREPPPPERREVEPSVAPGSLLAGVRFVRRSPVMLGAMTLDLFAVLFGGAVALLPVFARSILHVGPVGLGLLRTAPAAGALVAGMALTVRPLGARAGRTLLVVVSGFGVCMVVFGLSHSFWLSMGALALSGATDMVSMNIRSTIAALAAPDELRGRALAVELVFLSASNELGAFESGMAAALIGAAPAVVAGGLVTVALGAAWTRLFPALARIDRLEELHATVAQADVRSS